MRTLFLTPWVGAMVVAPFLYQAEIVRSDSPRLLVHWDFNGAANPAATHDKVYGLEGKLEGGAAFSAEGGGRSGVGSDRAVNYGSDGAGERVRVPSAPFLNLAAAQDKITVSLWQKLTAPAETAAFWGVSPSNNRRGIQAHVPWTDRDIYFDTSGCCADGAQRIHKHLEDSFDLSQWHHYAFVKNGEWKEIWVDGVKFHEGNGATPLPTDFTEFFLGSTGLADSLKGSQDDVAIFSGSLDGTQIAALAAGTAPDQVPGVVNPTTPLISGGFAPPTGVYVDIVEKPSNPIDPSTLALKLDGTVVTPITVTKTNVTTRVAYNLPAGTYFPTSSSHSVEVSVKDTLGDVTTSTFGFMTGVLTGPDVFLIEAADFDYGSGQHKAAVDVMPYKGGTHAGLGAVHGVDYYGVVSDSLDGNKYRPGGDPHVGIRDSYDTSRGTYSVDAAFSIGWNYTGDWFNFTRSFPGPVYNVYARHASGGGDIHAQLDEVTGGAATSTQTLRKLGTFDAPATGGYDTFTIVPLRTASGNLARVHLNGTRTVRWTMLPGNAEFNYLAFVPADADPDITSQSPDLLLPAGSPAVFSVTATGSGTLAYEWRKDGVPIPGQATHVLTIASVQASDAGNYTVRVTGDGGSLESEPFRLLLVPGAISKDLVAHLTFDDNVLDSSGRTNNGAVHGSPTFVQGKAGRALHLGASGDFVSLGAPAALNFGTNVDFSIAFWAKTGDSSGAPVFIGNGDWSTGDNQGYAIATESDGRLQWNTAGAPSSRVDYDGPAGVFSDHAWHHVAITFRRDGNIVTYLDGQEADNRPSGQNNLDTPQGFATNIGQDGSGLFGDSFTDADIDDLGIWRRALSSQEVAAIHGAGALGADLAQAIVPLPVPPPNILVQPSSLAVNAGEKAVLSMVADGAQPLSYQWRRNGTNVPGAKGNSLTLLDAKPADAGTYSVVVTDSFGQTQASAPAMLSVSRLPLVVLPNQGAAKATIYLSGQSGMGFTNLTKYPNAPEGIWYPRRFEWYSVSDADTPGGLPRDYLDLPSNGGVNDSSLGNLDNFGTRIEALLIPPNDGLYQFAIASDDGSRLFLSTDMTPAKKVLIATEPEWNSARDFTTQDRRTLVDVGTPDERYCNRSKWIPLKGGQAYYIEALGAEGCCGDSLSVAWRQSDEPDFFHGSRPIPGGFLAPLDRSDFSAPYAGALTANPLGFEWILKDGEGASASAVDPATVQGTVDGVAVAFGTSRTTTGLKLRLKKTDGAFASASWHDVSITYRDTKGVSASASRRFLVEPYATLAGGMQVTPDTSLKGFMVRTVQNEVWRDNQLGLVEAQLAGTLTDSMGQLLPNVANLTGADGEGRFSWDGVINFNVSSGDGHFTAANGFPESPVPGIPGTTGSTENFAVEITTYLDLPAGLVTLGVNSDDGFQTRAGFNGDVLNPPVVLGQFDGGRWSDDTVFSFVVEQPGVYPFRTIWYQGVIGANCEWYSVVDGTRILINDTNNPAAIKAYRAITATPALVKSVFPAVGATNVPVEDPVRVVLKEGSQSLTNLSLKLNGASVTPTVTRVGDEVTVEYQPSSRLQSRTTYEVMLGYSEGTVNKARKWQFVTAVGPVELTWANPTNIVYGTPLGSKQLAARANVPGTFYYSPAPGTILPAGVGQSLTVIFTPKDLVSYKVTTNTVDITVLPAPLVVTADSLQLWVGDPLPTPTFRYSGFVAGQGPGDLTSPAVASYSVGSTATPGTSPIVVGGAQGSNYAIQFVPGTLTVLNQVLPVVTWSAPASITYGTALSSLQLNASASVPGTFSYVPPAGSTLQAGNRTLAVQFTPTDTRRYSPASASVPIVVAPAVLTVQAEDKSRIAGLENPPLTVRYSGFVLGEGIGALTTLPIATTTATAASPDGSYPITPSGGQAANYSFRHVPGTLQVTSKLLPSVTWADPAPIAYGTVLSAAQLNAVADVPGTLSYVPPLGTLLGAGPSQVLKVTFVPASQAYETVTRQVLLDVNRSPLVVTAPNLTVVYGEAVPAISLQYQGFVAGENVAALATAPVATTPVQFKSPVGTYPITLSGGSSSNYALQFVGGSVDVTARPLTIAAESLEIPYGNTIPAFTFQASGLAPGDTAAGLATPINLTSAAPQAGTPAGQYAIIVGGGQDPNYQVTRVNGSLRVKKALASVSPQSASRRIGTPNPELTGKVLGFRLEDGITVQFTCAADEQSPLGDYPITPTYQDPKARLANYEVQATPGTLTVREELSLTGVALDGYVSGALVFFDANRNGQVDAEEPSTTTDDRGFFDLPVVVGKFDVNLNGVLDPSEGSLVMRGGVDISTGLPQATDFTAPPGSTVVNPLTTLLVSTLDKNPGLTTAQGENLLATALGLDSDIQLTTFDPYLEAANESTAAPSVLAASAIVQDTITQIAAVVSAVANESAATSAAAALDTLADRVVSGKNVAVSSPAEVSETLASAAQKVNATVPADVSDAASSIIASANTLKADIATTAGSAVEAAKLMAQAQVVAQTATSEALVQVVEAPDAAAVAALVASNTGAALTEQVAAAPVGDYLGVETRPGTFTLESASIQPSPDGSSVVVRLNRGDGNVGPVQLALRLLTPGGAEAARVPVAFADRQVLSSVDVASTILSTPGLASLTPIGVELVRDASDTSEASIGSPSLGSIQWVVPPDPEPATFTVSNPVQTVPNGTSTTPVRFSGTASSFTWVNNTPSIGLPASGTGDIASFTASNAGVAPVTATITVTPHYLNKGVETTGGSSQVTITVNPTPTLTWASNPSQTVTNGATTVPVRFLGNATIFSWQNDTPGIGLAALWAGDIPSFKAVNNGLHPVTATITVTPRYLNNGVNGAGTATNVTITVNPTPTVTGVSAPTQTVAAGTWTAPVRFTGNATSFTWVNNTPGIGLPASGTGDIAPFTGVNTGFGPVTATITVTPRYLNNGVEGTGASTSVTITVNPLPSVSVSGVSRPSQTVTNGATTAPVQIAGNATVFTWVNDTPSIGLAAVWAGDIPSFVAVNNGTLPATATITVTPRYQANGLNLSGAPTNVTITVIPRPTVAAVSRPSQTVTNRATTTPVRFTGTATSFTWVNDTPGIGLPASGAGDIEPFVAMNNGTVPVKATIRVTPHYLSNGVEGTGTSTNVTFTVNPTPTVAGVSILAQTVAHGATTSPVRITGNATSFRWVNDTPGIGLGGSGTWDIGSFVAVNNGTVPVTATIRVTPHYLNNGVEGTGTSTNVIVTVNPRPTVSGVSNPAQTVAGGATTAPVRFTGTATSFTWVNDRPGIGLPASGSGDIEAFTAVNAGTQPVTATIQVTPHYLGGGVDGTGVASEVTLTVNPTPTVAGISNPVQTVAAGSTTAPVRFVGTATSFTWVNDHPSIGLPASGSGDIEAFTAINAGSQPVTAKIRVTPHYLGGGVDGTGVASEVTLTVNPTPTVDGISSAAQTVANGATTAPVHFIGTATSFTWVNDTVGIGLATSGTGDIGSFLAVNNGSKPVTATITVTPHYRNDGVEGTGASTHLTITVNPTPTVLEVSNPAQVAWSGTFTAPVKFTGNATSYTWVNDTPGIGLAASGSGDIGSFVAVNNGSKPVTATITVTPHYQNKGVEGDGSVASVTIQVNPMPSLELDAVDGVVVLRWWGGYQLQSSTDITRGDWKTVFTNAVPGTNHWTNSPGRPMEFFRLKGW